MIDKQSIIDYLIKVKDLLRAGWCKKSFALKKGQICNIHEDADQYCLVGAIYHSIAANDRTWRIAAAILTNMHMYGKIGDMQETIYDLQVLIAFNDLAEHELEVISLIDRTILELEKDAVHESGTCQICDGLSA